MAYYSTKYSFSFDSVNGIKYQILIQQEGYSGDIIERNLGSSPILRKDSNGSICGTSLEIPAECIIDGEYAEFYTSNPFEYRVYLLANGAFIWHGFLTTEIYREPDIAPPYDVNLTATDGLGELKNDIFNINGEDSIHNILTDLLAMTGLSLRIDYVSNLQTVSPSETERTGLFQQLKTDIGHLNGKTCYDVLQQLMDTLHATITQLNGVWVVLRETDAAFTDDGVAAYRVTTDTPEYLPVASFGSMTSHDWWPVGNMTNDVRPAKNRMVITSANHYKQALKNPDMEASSGWLMSGNATYDSDGQYFKLNADTADGIVQDVNFARTVATPLLLNLRAASVGAGTGESIIRLTVKKEYQGTSQWLTNKADRNGDEILRWTDSSDDFVTLKLSSPASGSIDSIDVILPLFRRTARDYAYADKMYIAIQQLSDGLDKYIYGCSLVANEQLGGYENVISLNNGARGEGDNVEIAFARSSQIDKAGFFLYGLPFVGYSDVEATFKSGSIPTAMDFLSFITRDYALSYALPRLVVSGTLNVGGSKCPIGFIDSNGAKYLLQTMSWNLRNDDMDIEMLSLPAASISVDSEDVTAIPGTTAQSTGGSSTIGGSAGGGVSRLTDLLDVSIDPAALNEGDIPFWSSSAGKFVAFSSNRFGNTSEGGGDSGGTSNPYYDDAVIFTFANGTTVRLELENGATPVSMGETVEYEYGKDLTTCTKIEIGKNCTRIPARSFMSAFGWGRDIPVYCYGMTAPSIVTNSFLNLKTYNPRLIYPSGATGYNSTFKSNFSGSNTGAETPSGSGSGSGTGSGGTVTVIDNLVSFSSSYALSANQGRVLKGLIDGMDISKLNDVTITSPQQGQIMTYDGKKWVNGDMPSSEISYTSLISGGTKIGQLYAGEEIIGEIYAPSGSGGGGGAYILNAATTSTLGGLRIGYSSSDNKVRLELDSQDRAYVTITKAAITAALGFAPMKEGYVGTTKVQSEAAKQNLAGIGLLECDEVHMGDAVLSYDTAQNAIRVTKADGSVVNFYATGNVAALGESGLSDAVAKRIAALEARLDLLEGK